MVKTCKSHDKSSVYWNVKHVFIVAIAIGMGIILLTMILNIINAYKAHEPVASLV